jgi:hypothetical protein
VTERSVDLGVAVAFWAAIIGGSLVAVASLLETPTELIASGWTLLLVSVAGGFAVAVVGARRERLSTVQVLVRGMKAAFGWIVAFLP